MGENADELWAADLKRGQGKVPLRRADRECLFCGRRASVTVPEGASEMDVDAEFSGGGREFASVPDGDPIGVACYRCARKRWSVREPV